MKIMPLLILVLPIVAAEIFSEGYAGDSANWQELNPSRWQVKDDSGARYAITTSSYESLPVDRLGEYSLLPDMYTKFIFRADVKSTENFGSNPSADYCFVIDFTDSNNYKYIMFNTAAGQSSLFGIVNGQRQEIQAFDTQIPDNNYHNIRIERTERLILYFDDELLLDYNLGASTGQVGIGSYNDMANWDNIVVTSSDNPDQDNDGCISLTELISYMNKWKTGVVDITDILRTIMQWKEGCILPEEVIIDNGDAGTQPIGTWVDSASPGFYGTGSLYSKDIGDTYSWSASLQPGIYKTSIWWPYHENRATYVPVRIYDGSALVAELYIDQTKGGDGWLDIGSFRFNTGNARIEITSTMTDRSTNADAIRFTPATSTSAACTDKTPEGFCSVQRPKLCKTGTLQDTCSICGCASYQCQASGTCCENVCNGLCTSCADDPDCDGSCCGDGTINSGEECDDGNRNNGDGCSVSCNEETIPSDGQYPLVNGQAVFSFSLDSRQPVPGRGHISVADTDNDGEMEYILMTKTGIEDQPGTAGIGVYDHDGKLVWYNHGISIHTMTNAENFGLPGHSAPGYSKGDIDEDGQIEIVYIKEDRKTLVILNARNGVQEKTINLNPSSSESGFGLCQIVNLRGAGDRDVICQGWDIDHFNYLAAYRTDTGSRLWSRSDYMSVKHGGFRAVDLDGDRRDEVAGSIMVDDDGSRMNSWNYPININIHDSPHFDSIFIYDVRPDLPGMEVVLLEETWTGDVDYTAVVNEDKIVWRKWHNGWEPQNAAIGEFDTSRPGLEIWCRSRFDADQRPWVHDAKGNVIASWVMNDKKPGDWSTGGIEVINVIDWTGGQKQYIAAKERHVSGKVAVIDPMTGNFIKVWQNQAARLYVADVSGDYREELVVLNKNEMKVYVYWNPASNSNTKPRYWNYNYYTRQKDNFNYYSP